ncbi:MAG: periplasmic heavy metal sensor, partial [Cyanobacteria bacterium J083]
AKAAIISENKQITSDLVDFSSKISNDYYQQFAQNRRGRRKNSFYQLVQQLDLTPAQSEEIRAIQAESRPQITQLREEMRTELETMKSLLASDASDEELQQQHEKIQKLREQMGDLRFANMLKIRKVLTPEQREELARVMEQRQQQRINRQPTPPLN